MFIDVDLVREAEGIDAQQPGLFGVGSVDMHIQPSISCKCIFVLAFCRLDHHEFHVFFCASPCQFIQHLVDRGRFTRTGGARNEGMRRQIADIQTHRRLFFRIHVVNAAEFDLAAAALVQLNDFAAKLRTAYHWDTCHGLFGQSHLIGHFLAADEHGSRGGILVLFIQDCEEFRVVKAHEVIFDIANFLAVLPNIHSRSFHRRIFAAGQGFECTGCSYRHIIILCRKVGTGIKHTKVLAAAHPFNLLIDPIQQRFDRAILMVDLNRFTI